MQYINKQDKGNQVVPIQERESEIKMYLKNHKRAINNALKKMGENYLQQDDHDVVYSETIRFSDGFQVGVGIDGFNYGFYVVDGWLNKIAGYNFSGENYPVDFDWVDIYNQIDWDNIVDHMEVNYIPFKDMFKITEAYNKEN